MEIWQVNDESGYKSINYVQYHFWIKDYSNQAKYRPGYQNSLWAKCRYTNTIYKD